MSAGLPGLGLGGLFAVISALLAPLFELSRMRRGESSPDRWRQIWRQFFVAIAMVAVLNLTMLGALHLASALGLIATAPSGILAIPLAPVGITAGLLSVVLLGAKLAHGVREIVRALAARRASRSRGIGREPLPDSSQR